MAEASSIGGRTAGKLELSAVVRRGVEVPLGLPADALGVVLPDGRSAAPLGVSLPDRGVVVPEGRGGALPGVEAASGISCLAIGCQAPGTASQHLCLYWHRYCWQRGCLGHNSA